MDDDPSIYRAALGDAWATLPALIRRFHGEEAAAGARTVRGRMAVRRGRGFVAGLLCRLLRLPGAGVDLATELVIAPYAGGEDWRRRFGPNVLRTRQWLDAKGRLAEQIGPLVLGFRLTAAADGLRYVLEAAALGWRACAIPLPRALCAHIVATEQVDASKAGLLAHVRVTLPRGGLLLEYEGVLTP